METTNPKYIELISQSAEETQKEANVLKNEEAKLQLQGHKLELKKSVAEAKRVLLTLKKSETFNTREIYKQKNKIDLLERELTYAEELESELF